MSLESSAYLLYINKMIRIMTQTHQKTQDSNWLSDISLSMLKIHGYSLCLVGMLSCWERGALWELVTGVIVTVTLCDIFVPLIGHPGISPTTSRHSDPQL